PNDVGSPWAIGSAEGGHDAIHPDLGTMEDLEAFVARTRELGMEVALDLALQCAPDHPWVSEHPEWFTTRPDGTIAYAENPPKKYQDIYPVNFDNDPKGIRAEVLRIVLHWVSLGVRVFRVDNPHTKPVAFWEWLIWQAKKEDPGGTGQHAHPVLGAVLGIRAVRAPAPAGRRRVPGQREVPAAPARLGPGAGRGPVARAVPGPAQRDPQGQPGPAPAAQPPVP